MENGERIWFRRPEKGGWATFIKLILREDGDANEEFIASGRKKNNEAKLSQIPSAERQRKQRHRI